MRQSAAWTGAAGLLLLVAGCDGGKSEQNNAATTAAPAENYADQIAAMPQAQRDAVFIRAIRDANFDCQHVDASAATGPATWTATCSDHRQWTIAIGKNGNAQVTGTPSQAAAPGNSS